jgi:hypothetical protein
MYILTRLYHTILDDYMLLQKFKDRFFRSLGKRCQFSWESKHMKLNTLMILIFLFVLPVWGQAPDSSAGKQQKKEEKKVQKKEMKESDEQKSEKEEKQKQELEGFVDLNANGIDDRLETGKSQGKGKGKGAGKDRFIDLDGDGICDGQESAIGLRKVHRQRKGQSRNK